MNPQNLPPDHPPPLHSLYIHIPFCRHRCAYCDFNTFAGRESLIPAYVPALCEEIRCVAASAPRRIPVHTLFFGGGTPSLLTPLQLGQVLQTIQASFALVQPAGGNEQGSPPAPEISLEANPGTVTLASLHGLRQAGFNRISFGVQSFHAAELRLLERIHNPVDVQDAVRWARQAGFRNLNLDLIYGIPGQSLANWQVSLRQALSLGPEHLSLYALTIEPGTPFGRRAGRGVLPLPDPDLAANMVEWAADYLEGQGFERYEISNWSRPGFQCRHNLQYWRNQPYLGFGPGAHGCASGWRVSNLLRIKPYIERLNSEQGTVKTSFPFSPATVSKISISNFTEMQETMLLGLRLTQEGVSVETFRARFDREMMQVFGAEINDLIRLGLLEWAPPAASSALGTLNAEASRAILRLTRRGRMLGNQVFMRFVGG